MSMAKKPNTTIPADSILQFANVKGNSFQVRYRSSLGKILLTKPLTTSALDEAGLTKFKAHNAKRVHPVKAKAQREAQKTSAKGK